jgi:HEPN domain-containing protein
VDESRRKMAADWINKAQVHLNTAKTRLETRCQASEAIEAAQECVELSVKAILTRVNIEFPRCHGWNEKQLKEIVEQITTSTVSARLSQLGLSPARLGRLLALVNLWNQFYIQAKYGIEAGNLASAQDLFTDKEGELAVAHAEECWYAAALLGG